MLFLYFDQTSTRSRLQPELIYLQSMTRVSPQTLQQMSRPYIEMTQYKKQQIVLKFQINSRSSLDLDVRFSSKVVKGQSISSSRSTLVRVQSKFSETLVKLQIQSKSREIQFGDIVQEHPADPFNQSNSSQIIITIVELNYG